MFWTKLDSSNQNQSGKVYEDIPVNGNEIQNEINVNPDGNNLLDNIEENIKAKGSKELKENSNEQKDKSKENIAESEKSAIPDKSVLISNHQTTNTFEKGCCDISEQESTTKNDNSEFESFQGRQLTDILLYPVKSCAAFKVCFVHECISTSFANLLF